MRSIIDRPASLCKNFQRQASSVSILPRESVREGVMSEQPLLLVETIDGVCCLTLNRPDKLNSVNDALGVPVPVGALPPPEPDGSTSPRPS